MHSESGGTGAAVEWAAVTGGSHLLGAALGGRRGGGGGGAWLAALSRGGRLPADHGPAGASVTVRRHGQSPRLGHIKHQHRGCARRGAGGQHSRQ